MTDYFNKGVRFIAEILMQTAFVKKELIRTTFGLCMAHFFAETRKLIVKTLIDFWSVIAHSHV